MLNRYTIFAALCVTIVAAAEMGAIITTVTPAEASRVQLGLFFICFWIVLCSILTPIWYGIKQYGIYPNHPISRIVCLRQAALASLLATLALFFNSLRILSLWDLIPLAISMLLIEFFFQADSTLPTTNEHS